MKLTAINKLPRFIGEYFNAEMISHYEIKAFSNLLLSLDYTLLDDNKLICVLDNKPEFIDFYITKSKLDEHYFCKYEDELGVPKSISNETYTVELEGGKVDVLLEFDDECNCLILNMEP